ncbi:hypothetical protein WH87_09755 [Devosia epidermidihirudinis]|uniref:Uncharacterized protein n=1 Tax=Devosia epidermidihirudinis TaxID=1293439 RepID=A0A0F5QD53_9HYPH|nr:hypothetical protein WH87_09755 [Devosia epidermidihirudinis]
MCVKASHGIHTGAIGAAFGTIWLGLFDVSLDPFIGGRTGGGIDAHRGLQIGGVGIDGCQHLGIDGERAQLDHGLGGIDAGQHIGALGRLGRRRGWIDHDIFGGRLGENGFLRQGRGQADGKHGKHRKGTDHRKLLKGDGRQPVPSSVRLWPQHGARSETGW